jgi:hypothetical protein
MRALHAGQPEAPPEPKRKRAKKYRIVRWPEAGKPRLRKVRCAPNSGPKGTGAASLSWATFGLMPRSKLRLRRRDASYRATPALLRPGG